AGSVGLGAMRPVFEARVSPEVLTEADARLAAAGRGASRPLVCLNPAGGWPTKPWPLECYAGLGERVRREAGVQRHLVGRGGGRGGWGGWRGPRVAGGVALRRPPVLALVGKTTPGLALGVLCRAALVVSDDSGLMHAAACQGIPAIALFGASRSVWSAPVGPR